MEHTDLREKVLMRKTEFEGRIIKVQQWQVALPDGREANREVVLHNGAAAVVPLDSRHYVTLVRQHRVVIDEVTLEIPAGKLDSPGEDPFLCAQRELLEETGYVAGKWQKLASVVTTPGFCTERIALYLAMDLRQVGAQPDADEFLNTVRMPLAEAILMVESGQITDAKTCLALLMAQRAVNQPAYIWQEGLGKHPGGQTSYPQAKG